MRRKVFKRRRRALDQPPAEKRRGMWRPVDYASSRARRHQLAAESQRLANALAQERRLSLRAPPATFDGLYGDGGREMRVRWMFREGRALSIAPSTVGLAVMYVDRIVRGCRMRIGDVQKVAAACLHIARKICEVGGDGMQFVETKDCRMNADVEMFAVVQLEWRLVLPTAYTFLPKLADKIWIAATARPIALSYLESIICWEESTKFYPSVIACVAILALSRDDKLHPTSKRLLFDYLKSLNMADEVVKALRIFIPRINDLHSGGSYSWKVATTDEEVYIDLLFSEFVERNANVPNA